MTETPATNLFSCYEQTIKKIDNVEAVNIVGDEEGHISEIHVLASSKRTAKQIVRDIETLLKVEYSLDVDHKKISVVQFAADPRLEMLPRLQFKGIGSYRSGSRLEIKVELFLPPDTLLKGEAVGLNITAGRQRLVAQATINAIEEALGEVPLHAFVEEVALFTIAQQKAVLVMLTLITSRGKEQFLGAAKVNEDEMEAVVRGTLDALNRFIGRLLKTK